jgi:hypothetical protein
MNGNKPMYTDVLPFTNVIIVAVAVVNDHCLDRQGTIRYTNWLQKGIKLGQIWNEPLRTIPGQKISLKSSA